MRSVIKLKNMTPEDKYKEIEGMFKRLSDQMCRVVQAFYLWRALVFARSIPEVGKKQAEKNVEIMGFHKNFFTQTEDSHLTTFIIGISGHGNVARGVREVLGLLNPIEIHPRDMLRFVRRQKGMRNRIYKIVFLREEKFRSKDGKGFYFEEYLKHPKKFESNMDMYLQYLNIFIHTSYWDSRYPRTVTKEMIHKLTRKKPFRLEFIGDIACDINGSIEPTYKTTSSRNPVFTYNPENGVFSDGYKTPGISIMAVDNLPSELPKDSSVEFSSLIHDYVYQIAAHGVKDITRHAALPVEIRKAVVIEEGKLTKRFDYLKKILARQIAVNKKRCADALLLNC